MNWVPKNLPDAAAAYIASMPPGDVYLFPLTPLDRTGVPCWNAMLFNADGRQWVGVAPHGVGYGLTDADAIVGTTGELAEAAHSSAQFARLPSETGDFASMVARHGARAVLDPLTLCLPAGSAYAPDMVRVWCAGTAWPSGERRWAPLEYAACSVGDLPDGYTPLITPITNGLGAGPDAAFAIGHGVCELLQRDGNGQGFRAMDRGITLDLRPDFPLDARTRDLLAHLRGLGIDVIPKFADDEFGVANVYVVGADPSATFPIMATAAGEAASLDREHALRKALLEFAAARARKLYMHGPIDALRAVCPPGYLDHFRRLMTLSGEEGRTMRAMTDWMGRDTADLIALLQDSVLSQRSNWAFDALPRWDGALSGICLLEEIARRLAFMEIVWFDFSPPGARDVAVVKALVPGLEVEQMSYHRLGERGVRKFLARGGDLVGFGTPPPGALPIRLPPGAAERLGGVPWYDVRAVDRIVDDLYALYREPEAHSVQVALEAAP